MNKSFNYKNLIRKTFPFKIEKNFKCGEGQDCIAFLVNNDYVVKFPKNIIASSKLKNEINLLKFLETKILNIEVPKVLDVVLTGVEKKPFYSIITKMEGKTLSRKQFDKLSVIDKSNIAKDIALFLHKLHTLNYNGLGVPFVDIKDAIFEDYNQLINNYYNSFNLKQLQKLKESVKEIISFYESLTIENAIVHGDFSIDVIFYDYIKKVCGIIDFGDCYIGDRDNDFMYLLEDLEDYPIEFGEKVVNFYGVNNGINIDLVLKKTKIENYYWHIRQIIKGQKLNDKKLIKKSIIKLIKLLEE